MAISDKLTKLRTDITSAYNTISAKGGIVSKNLADRNKFVMNKYINVSGVEADSTVSMITDYIPVESGQYTFSGIMRTIVGTTPSNTIRIHEYDENKNWVRQIKDAIIYPSENRQSVSFDVNNTGKYVRISMFQTWEEIQVEKGNLTPYEPFFNKNTENLSTAINSIPSGGSDGYKPIESGVIFINYDGKELYSYTTEEAMALSTLPELPNNEGFKEETWNWTLEQIKSYLTELPDNIVVVGVNLVSTDEKTHILYEVNESNKNINLNIFVNGTTVIDWGDGTSTSSLSGTSVTSGLKTANHVYANVGTYEITLSGGSIGFTASSYHAQRSGLINTEIASTETTNFKNYRTVACLMGIKKIFLGKNFSRINAYGLSGLQGLEVLSIPSNTSVPTIGSGSFQNYSIQYCYSLKCVVMPSVIIDINSTIFYYLYNCEYVSLPYGIRNISASNFSYMYSLKVFTFPIGVTTLSSGSSFRTLYIPIKTNGKLTNAGSYFGAYNYAGSGDYNFNDKLTTIGSYFLAYTYSQDKIDLSMTKITSVSGNTFMNSYAREIILPDTVTSISTSAFANCFILSRVKFPPNISSISNSTFTNCYACSLYDFRRATRVPTLGGTSGFTNISPNAKFVVPDSLYSTWIATANWANFASKIIKASDYTGD